MWPYECWLDTIKMLGVRKQELDLFIGHTKCWVNDSFYDVLPISISLEPFRSLLKEAITNHDNHLGKTYPVINDNPCIVDAEVTFGKENLAFHIEHKEVLPGERNPYVFDGYFYLPYTDIPELLRLIDAGVEMENDSEGRRDMSVWQGGVLLLRVNLKVKPFPGLELSRTEYMEERCRTGNILKRIDSKFWQCALNKVNSELYYPISDWYSGIVYLHSDELLKMNRSRYEAFKNEFRKIDQKMGAPAFYLTDDDYNDIEFYKERLSMILPVCIKACEVLGKPQEAEQYRNELFKLRS